MMNLSQTKLVGLTMELDLKTREYKKLCDKLENLKQGNINPHYEKLLELKQLFQKNHDEIVEINRQLRLLKEDEEKKQEKTEKYNPDNLFKNKQFTEKKQVPALVVKETENKNLLRKIIGFIKKS